MAGQIERINQPPVDIFVACFPILAALQSILQVRLQPTFLSLLRSHIYGMAATGGHYCTMYAAAKAHWPCCKT